MQRCWKRSKEAVQSRPTHFREIPLLAIQSRPIRFRRVQFRGPTRSARLRFFTIERSKFALEPRGGEHPLRGRLGRGCFGVGPGGEAHPRQSDTVCCMRWRRAEFYVAFAEPQMRSGGVGMFLGRFFSSIIARWRRPQRPIQGVGGELPAGWRELLRVAQAKPVETVTRQIAGPTEIGRLDDRTGT